MKAVAVICARLGSTRLPEKVLAPIAGKPLIQHTIERTARSNVDHIVLAVPHNEMSRFAEVARTTGVDLWGSTLPVEDVLGRIYYAQASYDADLVVRIPGDQPCVEPAEINRLLGAYDARYCRMLWSNTHNFWGRLMERGNIILDWNGYPDGLGCEVYSRELLLRTHETVTHPLRREHPHLTEFLHGNVVSVDCPMSLRTEARLDVDTQEDLDRIRGLFAAYDDNTFWIGDTVIRSWASAGDV